MAMLPTPDEFYTAIIDRNGDIMAVSSTREYRKMGIDIPREKQLLQQISDQQEVIDNYYNKLLELGVIQPVKTPEEIAHEAAQEQIRIAHEQAAQQSQINQSLLEAIQGLKTELGELRNGTNGHSGTSNGKNTSNIGGIKKKPGGSKVSPPTGNKADPRHISEQG